ncbi:hypothetical protein XH88_06645 [Bradyrhizobium sp. CCBAU 51627]|nr:hypothetical protein [Bradyrhizobium sp. CCBAU 51627]
MLAILTECIFERLRAAREQATKMTILFADDPVAKTILANKDGRALAASGRKFGELHDHMPMSLGLRRLEITAPFHEIRSLQSTSGPIDYVFWCPRPSPFSAGRESRNGSLSVPAYELSARFKQHGAMLPLLITSALSLGS